MEPNEEHKLKRNIHICGGIYWYTLSTICIYHAADIAVWQTGLLTNRLQRNKPDHSQYINVMQVRSQTECPVRM